MPRIIFVLYIKKPQHSPSLRFQLVVLHIGCTTQLMWKELSVYMHLGDSRVIVELERMQSAPESKVIKSIHLSQRSIITFLVKSQKNISRSKI